MRVQSKCNGQIGAVGVGLSPLDAAVLRDGKTWAGRAGIAKDFAVPMGVVESRFHRLRASNHRAPAAVPAPRPNDRAAPGPVAAPAVETFQWTRERITEAFDLRQAGCTTPDIAELFAVTPGAVRMMFRRVADKAKAADSEAAE